MAIIVAGLMFYEHGEGGLVHGRVVPIADKRATWDVFIAWQRGKISAPLRALVDALTAKSEK
jgi:hypothetical protein